MNRCFLIKSLRDITQRKSFSDPRPFLKKAQLDCEDENGVLLPEHYQEVDDDSNS